jgi:hypothetical protein
MTVRGELQKLKVPDLSGIPRIFNRKRTKVLDNYKQRQKILQMPAGVIVLTDRRIYLLFHRHRQEGIDMQWRSLPCN